MCRPAFSTRSQTAPQLPPILPISPVTIPFNDPFYPSKSPNYYHHAQVSPLDPTHPFTRSTSCLPSLSPHPQTPLQRYTSWPLRRASFASSSSTTKSLQSLKSLPLNTPTGSTINRTRVFHRLRSSFSTFLTAKLEDLYLEREQKSRQDDGDDESRDEELWDRGWERGYEGSILRIERGSLEEGDNEDGSCLHLPPEISMDRSEIEYLRRLEREALSARGMRVTA